MEEAYYRKKKDKGIRNGKMYGAEIGFLGNELTTGQIWEEVKSASSEAADIVSSTFRDYGSEGEILLDHSIWLKFTGSGAKRHKATEKANVFSMDLGQGEQYYSNYPFIPAVKDGDEVYVAAVTTDSKGKDQPVIIARGILRGYDKKSVATDDMKEKAQWMERYPYYCIIDQLEILNTENQHGIPLDAILQELGSDTYVASYGRNESIFDVSKKHHQKAHLRLTGNAKVLIDKKFDELAAKYGSRNVRSN